MAIITTRPKYPSPKKIIRQRKQGLAPGSLMFTGEKKVEKTLMSLIDFTAENLVEKKITDIRETLPFKDSNSITWINVDGIHDSELVRTIGELFNIHPLVLEDILNPNQRPKIEFYPDFMYIVMKMPEMNHETGRLDFEQMSIIFAKNFIITLQERPGDCFDPLRDRIRNTKTRVRNSGIDFMLYALVDSIIDDYFSLLEDLGDRIQAVEDSLLEGLKSNMLVNLQNLKRDTIFLRKYVWPSREVINALNRTDSELIKPETKLFLHDVYDHLMRIMESVDSYRDLTSGIQDLYLSITNNRMNEVMKVLAIISTIFLPLTLISSIYGMNFDFMPGLHEPLGFWVTVGVMCGIAGTMLFFFRRKGWV